MQKDELEKIFIEYLTQTTKKVKEMADNGQGRKILGLPRR